MADNPYINEYEAYATQAKTAYQRALAKIEQQRSGYLQGYGLGADGRPVADNPYGAYQQMMGSLAQTAEESEAMQRARGFTGGLSRQAMQAADRMARQTTYDFGQQFQRGISEFAESEAGAGMLYNNQLFEKMQELTQRSIQDRMFSPADYSGINYEGYGDASPNPGSPGIPFKPPAKKKKRKKKRRRR